MKAYTPKKVWFAKFAKKAKFTLAPEAFQRLAKKSLEIFQEAEKQEISQKIVCERIGSPEELIKKTAGEERKIGRKFAAIIGIIAIFSYFFWWWRIWAYIMDAFKMTLLVLGTVLLPFIYTFLCGKSYYKICADLLQEKEKNTQGLTMLAFGAELCFVILGVCVFPLGICKEIFTYEFLLVFLALFLGITLFLTIYGMVKIQRFQISAQKFIYLGNGMLHSFFLWNMWNEWMYECETAISYMGVLVVPLPFVVDYFLYLLERKK